MLYIHIFNEILSLTISDVYHTITNMKRNVIMGGLQSTTGFEYLFIDSDRK